MLLLSTYVLCAVAQDTEEGSKKEFTLPEWGSFAIGVDAMPFINFAGNMFNATNKQTLGVGETTIYGKYLMIGGTIRAELYLNNNKTQDLNYVTDQSQSVAVPSEAQVEDLKITKTNAYGLGIGYQKYIGQKRVRGFYGAMFNYYRYNQQAEYFWGNEMNKDNSSPISSPWVNDPYGGSRNQRTLMYDGGLTQTFGLGALLGVECFITSQISISGELGIYALYSTTTQADKTYETIENGVYTEKDYAKDPGGSSFNISTQVYQPQGTPSFGGSEAGRLYISFYF